MPTDAQIGEPVHLTYDIEQNWPAFSRDVWDQHPAVFDHVPDHLRIDADELFETVLAATRDQGAGLNPATKFYIDQTAQLLDIDRYVPQRCDGGLKGYFDRMLELVGGRSFLLVINHLNLYNSRLWTDSARFLSGLYQSTGKVPFGQVDIDVFLGDYPCTPFGVHFDGATNFMTVPYGTKRMIVWPDDVPAPMSTIDYEDTRSAGMWLDCDQSQMIYWPGFHRHVGEARDGPSASVNLALYMETRFLDDMFALLERELTGRFPDLCSGGMYAVADEAPATLPELMEDVRAALPELTGSAGFRTQVQRHWLEKYTGYGFDRVAPPISTDLQFDPDGRLQMHDHSRVVWDAEHRVLAANGHSRVVLDTTIDIDAVVRAVRSRTGGSLLEVAQEAGIEPAPASVAELRSVLRFLFRCEAIGQAS